MLKAVPAVSVCYLVQGAAQVRHVGSRSRGIILWPHPPVCLAPGLYNCCLVADDKVISAQHRHPGDRAMIVVVLLLVVIELVDDAPTPSRDGTARN